MSIVYKNHLSIGIIFSTSINNMKNFLLTLVRIIFVSYMAFLAVQESRHAK